MGSVNLCVQGRIQTGSHRFTGTGEGSSFLFNFRPTCKTSRGYIVPPVGTPRLADMNRPHIASGSAPIVEGHGYSQSGSAYKQCCNAYSQSGSAYKQCCNAYSQSGSAHKQCCNAYSQSGSAHKQCENGLFAEHSQNFNLFQK